MKTATGLTLLAIGAILAFAVSGHPSFLNIQVAGWVIMAVGMAGVLVPRRGTGWLRRRMVLKQGPGGRRVVDRVDETRYPPYIMLNPGTLPGGQDPILPEAPTEPRSAAGQRRAGGAQPAEEVVEEYLHE